MLLSFDSLAGTNVRNASDQDLGEIDDFMVDTRHGNIAYAVLSFGGFLGLGDKLFAIPFEMLHLDTTNECFVLNIDKAKLEEAPGFDKSDWPDAANYNFINEVYAYYDLDYRGNERLVRTDSVPYETA